MLSTIQTLNRLLLKHFDFEKIIALNTLHKSFKKIKPQPNLGEKNISCPQKIVQQPPYHPPKKMVFPSRLPT